ncbi:X-X-X-Leu-X-X-Gly heptad repeat-containing protein [Gracilibacillus ureilyticus]|uniref:X-X-X-Leu-X-X-Gly heptad repeat-containing protein n=1 Tax=Gracilibacillus ureilyticus TaxID=531814 RepID=A0A1H9P8W8_9BACI|nr:hypothetical protein [Gracilibacillus ureilyticus]SER44345.1 X-X-X-Leu-X-X-Gly heptad repeat-containing protein [Gracilibacillus ureilyticus]
MRRKHIIVVLLTLVLIFPPFLLSAAPNEEEKVTDNSGDGTNGEYKNKDEVIYATLSATGDEKAMYVVNRFDVTKSGEIIDHGPYESVKNLTNLSEIEQTDQKVSFQAEEGEFFYQGNMDNQSLPWEVDVTYTLNGQKTDPENLLGKDGKLQIDIATSPNESEQNSFYQNYLLQVSMTLDPAIFNNIEATEATIANAGKNKQITYTVMPGKEGDMSLSADVTDFELNGIEISAVPSSMSIETPDVDEMTGEMETLADAVAEINSGVAELEEGIATLDTGVNDLVNGSQQYNNGMAEISQSSTEIINASTSIKDALSLMNQSLQGDSGDIDLTQLTQLPDGLVQMGNGLSETATGLSTLQENYVNALNTLNEAVEAMPSHEITEEQINALYSSGANSDVVDKLVETYKSAKAIKTTYNQVKEVFFTVEGTLNQVNGSLNEMSGSLNTMATNLSDSLDTMDVTDSLGQLQEGIAGLSTNYQEFHNGLVSYTNGVSQLAENYSGINSGIAELSSGTGALSTGVGELHGGTAELADATDNMPDEIRAEVDEMIEEYDKSDFDPVSFVSKKNEKVETVQFVIKTESIVKEEVETEEIEEEQEDGFWSRLVELFS